MSDNNTTTANGIKGALGASLARNGSKIRADRAGQIADDARIEFRRKIEDLDRDIRRLRREKESLLDMSPDNEFSIISAKKFDVDEFINQTVSIKKNIHNKQILFDLLVEEYEFLFGETLNLPN